MADYNDLLADSIENDSRELVDLLRRRPNNMAEMRARNVEALEEIERIRVCFEHTEKWLKSFAPADESEKS
jgi:hypothetical protein